MMKIKIKIADIFFDESMYIRNEMNNEHKEDIKNSILNHIKIKNYDINSINDASEILNELKIPNLILFNNKDSGKYYLIDGFHRYNAIKEIFGENVYVYADLIEEKQYDKIKILKEMIKYNLHDALKLTLNDRFKILQLYYDNIKKQYNLSDSIILYLKVLNDLAYNFPNLFNSGVINHILNKNEFADKFIKEIILEKYAHENVKNLKEAIYKEFKNQNLTFLLELDPVRNFIDKIIGMINLHKIEYDTNNVENEIEVENEEYLINEEEMEKIRIRENKRRIKAIKSHFISIYKAINNIKAIIYVLKVNNEKIEINKKDANKIKELYYNCLNELENLNEENVFNNIINDE